MSGGRGYRRRKNRPRRRGAGTAILREIEFPSEYHQAGIGIMNYFAEVLRQKYSDTPAAVQITQEELTVRMTVETVDGHTETVEKALEEYWHVVSDKQQTAEILSYPVEIEALQQRQVSPKSYGAKTVKMTAPSRGENTSELIRQAKKSIKVTHFSGELLTQDYISILLRALNHGVEVTLLVYCHADVKHNYEWLRHLRDENGNFLPCYSERVILEMPHALDMVIVDDEVVIASLPVHVEVPGFSCSLVIDDPEAVHGWKQVFLNLELRSVNIEEARVELKSAKEIPDFLK